MTSELRVDKIVPTTGVPTGGGGGINGKGGGGGSGYTDGSVTIVDTQLGGSTGYAKVVLRVIH